MNYWTSGTVRRARRKRSDVSCLHMSSVLAHSFVALYSLAIRCYSLPSAEVKAMLSRVAECVM